VRLDAQRFTIGADASGAAQCRTARWLRGGLAPVQPDIAQVPLARRAWPPLDTMRYRFERLPTIARPCRRAAAAALLGAGSLLVFDHLTRGIAAAGSEAIGGAATCGDRALRGPARPRATATAPGVGVACQYSPACAVQAHRRGVSTQCCLRFSAGTARSVPGVSRAAVNPSLHVL
jgi:hypothetical protein